MSRKRTLDDFETHDSLDAVDHLDRIRGILADGPHLEPPEIHTDLLKVHGLVEKVCQSGKDTHGEMFALATDIEDQVDRIRREAVRILKVLRELTEMEFQEDPPASEG